jgi:formylglycine-generating enzyme required for sulfatase activity
VGWHAAADYCNDVGGRLPTEAEWEYAASGGLVDCLYPWGNEISPAHALYDLTPSFPWRKLVRKFLPNRFGLFDIVGGVWEWCSDGRPDRKIVKGGSWRSKAEELQLSHRKERHIDLVGAPLDDTGFRCVLL